MKIPFSATMTRALSYELNGMSAKRFNADFVKWVDSLFYGRTTRDPEQYAFRSVTFYLARLSPSYLRQLYKLVSYGARASDHGNWDDFAPNNPLGRRAQAIRKYVRGDHPLERLARCADTDAAPELT